jgi:S-formylglutathione hydrolase FrmB
VKALFAKTTTGFNRIQHFISLLLVFSNLLLVFTAYSAVQKVITIPSIAMHKELKATIIIPDSYSRSQNHYSVIYLLHGFGGDHTVWPRIAPLERYSDSLALIFVCPDGADSWYIDSPVKNNSLFETYIIHEVIPFIDFSYRTWAVPGGRALIGLSMGGHGAISLLAKHPDLFVGACSISGIMDLTEFPFNWELPRILGPFAQNQQRWIHYSCISQIDTLKNGSKFIVLDCGLEDFAWKGNQKEHLLMEKAGIPHSFYSHHGIHDWPYVKMVAAGHFFAFSKRLQPATIEDGIINVLHNH